MKYTDNNKGFALITSLMLTMLSLTIVMALLLMITQGTQMSGLNKKYKTSIEASYGGAEILARNVMPFVMQNYSSATLKTDLESEFYPVHLDVVSASCLQTKLRKPTSAWPSICSSTPNPKQSPDITYTMEATAGNPFIVYSKIVHTTSGNTDISGIALEGTGVAESSSILSPQHFPYIYRLEVQGERQNSAGAQANIEVLYAY